MISLLKERRKEKRKLKTKAIVAVMMTMLLVTLASCVFPVRAPPSYIKIGVIGPAGWPQMQGMVDGATLAAEWINGPGGGIVIEGTRYDVQIVTADEHAADMRPDLGAAEMERLCDPARENVDFVIGGFRTECVLPIREVAADYHKLFFITGAATNRLIDCGYPSTTQPAPCGHCVRCDYDRYKYMFRVTPINDTMLAYNILGFLKGYVLPSKLVPLYGEPINTAVIAEDLDWTVTMYNMFTLGASTYLGPQANIVYSARTPFDEDDFGPYLDAMHAAEARLIIHIFSAPASIAFITQWADHPVKAVTAGIDVLGQSTAFWGYTGGKCETEAFLATSGTRTPLSTLSQPYTTTELWDLYYGRFGYAPVYTAWGAYDSIIAMHDSLEGGTIHPPFDQANTDALIPIVEQTDREAVTGRFRYTGPHPTVPGAMLHDVFSNEFGATWTERYSRATWVQWQAGRLEVVWPMDQPYSKMYACPNLPSKMYPYPTDLNQDGLMDTADISAVGYAFGSSSVAPNVPAHPRWQFVADYDRNKFIDMSDATPVCYDFGKTVTLPIAY